MSSINVSQSVMSNSHEQAVLPIFAYPIITVAVILIAVAAIDHIHNYLKASLEP